MNLFFGKLSADNQLEKGIVNSGSFKPYFSDGIEKGDLVFAKGSSSKIEGLYKIGEVKQNSNKDWTAEIEEIFKLNKPIQIKEFVRLKIFKVDQNLLNSCPRNTKGRGFIKLSLLDDAFLDNLTRENGKSFFENYIQDKNNYRSFFVSLESTPAIQSKYPDEIIVFKKPNKTCELLTTNFFDSSICKKFDDNALLKYRRSTKSKSPKAKLIEKIQNCQQTEIISENIIQFYDLFISSVFSKRNDFLLYLTEKASKPVGSDYAKKCEQGIRAIEDEFSVNMDDEFSSDKCKDILQQCNKLELPKDGDSNTRNYSSYINRFVEYKEFESNPSKDSLEISYQSLNKPKNRIIYGAPGTGKSYLLESEREENNFLDGFYERVTFHQDYYYSSFVGSLKPSSNLANNSIEYKYIPGPFLRLLVKAIKDPKNNYLLIIEEINRANPAAVFGDIFQLLDRNEEGISEYDITISEEMKKYLESVGINEDVIKIPSNYYIWATMNSADQNVFPMDTAFKRRWSFEYLDINNPNAEEELQKFAFGSKWNDIRKKINDFLSSKNLNEDKLLGPFFITPKDLSSIENYKQAFREKVLMYLFEDAGKLFRNELFIMQNNRLSSVIIENSEDENDIIYEKIFRFLTNN